MYRNATPMVVNGLAFFRVCNGGQGYGDTEALVYAVDATTGATVGTVKNSAWGLSSGIGLGTENSGWVGGDGRAFLECGRDGGSRIAMVVADKRLKMSAINIPNYAMSSTPCYADGRLYLRTQKGLLCLDLRAK